MERSTITTHNGKYIDKTMQLNIDPEDLKSIARDVVETLKPLLKNNKQGCESDCVFDVKELAAYLRVNKSWVYNQVHLKSIPYFKCGRYTRFKKSNIDRWISSETIQVIPALSSIDGRR